MPTTVTKKLIGGKRCKEVTKKATDDKPLISIITAVFNGNATIEETIKSVLNQSYSNLEYLVIDGGSSDGTIETLRKYDSYIDYWISEPDQGAYDAMNKGIDLACGDWIYFLGADDKFFDNIVLEAFFSRPPSSKMLYGNVLRAHTGIYDGEFTQWKILYKNICQQAIFYHRDLFRTYGKFDFKYPILADWLFNMRAFTAKDTKPLFVDSIVAHYADGMSVHNRDKVFFLNYWKNIREIIGPWKFVYFIIYYCCKAVPDNLKRLIKI